MRTFFLFFILKIWLKIWKGELFLAKCSLNIVRPPARSGQPISHSLTLISLGVNSALIWLPLVFTPTLHSHVLRAPYLISLQSPAIPAFLGVLIFVWYGLNNLLLLLENFYLYLTNIVVCNVEISAPNMWTKYLKVILSVQNGQCSVRTANKTIENIYYFQTSPIY